MGEKFNVVGVQQVITYNENGIPSWRPPACRKASSYKECIPVFSSVERTIFHSIFIFVALKQGEET